ncbi:MAG: response regulator [Treponema sp.]|jgi:signal transduction histidine kinase/DNA-binding response OmpR family regulator|nr:response regulator [Treponema sp.]
MLKVLSGKASRTLYSQLLFTALAFVIMVVLSYFFMSSIVRESQIRNANSVLDFTQSGITMDMSDSCSLLSNFAQTTQEMIVSGTSEGELKDYFDEISYYTNKLGSQALDAKGYYAYIEALPSGPVLIQGNDWSVSDSAQPTASDWYTQAVAANGDIIATVPYISGSQGTLFAYAKAMYNDEGERLGVVGIDVSLNVIGQEIVDTAINQGGYGVLVNQDFLILAHPNTDFIGLSVDDPIVPLSKNVARILREKGEVFEQPLTSYSGEDAVAFFRTIPNGWFLGIVSPTDQFYQGTNTMGAVLIILGTVLCIILISILIQIDKARVRSDEENRQKSMFLANMSHEIRTPINAIVGMTAIGRVAGVMDRKNYCFSKIDDASRHLLGVISDILDISKIEANKIELFETDFNFERMLQQVVNVVNFRVDEKKQKLTVHIDKTIPRILHADDQRFAQVITNLLSNAVKFTPDDGHINLSTKLVSHENSDYIIKVSITDNGIGISPEQQKHLFQSFQQAESSTTRRYGGTVLGLAISKNIVEMMGGKIWVESDLGQGATFAFTIKAKRGDESNFNLGYHGINWQNIRILTIDDDLDILVYFREIVKSFGAQCDVAANAEEALRLVDETGGYNIYFVDLKMPDVDGISLTKEIRAREKDPGNSVVIMISSADLSSVEAEAKKAGVNKFLLKPLFPSSISDVINECIGIVNTNTEAIPTDINGIFEGHNVLFAEDIDINREIVMALLEPTGVHIECAENGAQAVQMFYKNPEKYDLIFMDVQMPEMDGYEATRQIRALNNISEAQTIPIIAMTANVFKEDIENCHAAGMNAHLGKPLNMDDLIEMMLRFLKKNRTIL